MKKKKTVRKLMCLQCNDIAALDITKNVMKYLEAKKEAEKIKIRWVSRFKTAI